MFTVNPAFPHPDQDTPDTSPTLDEAVSLAYALLMHDKEGPNMQHARRRAAFDLIDAYEIHIKQDITAELIEALRQLVRAATHHQEDAPAALKAARAAIMKATQ